MRESFTLVTFSFLTWATSFLPVSPTFMVHREKEVLACHPGEGREQTASCLKPCAVTHRWGGQLALPTHLEFLRGE
jgi:hypothetical protein